MKNIIEQRLSADDLISRMEANERAWLSWALFWAGIGAIGGCAATLLLIEIWGRQ
jgi:hypothetical protein